jgi:uncharacterized protein
MSGRGDRSSSLRSGAPAVIAAYRRILERAASRKQQTHSMVRKLRQLKPKELVQLFEELHEQAFMQIDCLSCANCCASVGPMLNEQDVQRAAKSLRMKNREFIDTYLRQDEDGDLVFRTMPCPFLCGDNRCLIYEDRPKACREYPHTDQRYVHRYLKQTEINSRHCPAVACMFEELAARGW